MIDFFVQYWPEVALSIVTAGALGFCKHLTKKMKEYQSLLDNKEQQELETNIDKKIEPIVQEIEDLRNYVYEVDQNEKRKMDLIIASYKFRLVQLCKMYLKQEYMTQSQYDQLIEFFKMYSGLGGNGQAKEYYEKTIKLPIKG